MMGRNRRMALALGLIMPGLGQLYNGEIVKGLSFFSIGLAAAILGSRWTVALPDQLLLAGALLTFLITLAVYVFSVLDAYRRASSMKAVYMLKSYNQWYFYLAFWLMGILITGSALEHIRENYLEAYRIPTQSMAPAVESGDYLLADKSAYRRMSPRTGDLVIFYNPDNRSQMYIKRIVALPGSTVAGTDIEVPHGYVYVMGDNSANSTDSRSFGFLPLRDIVGKARQIYFSSGPDGIRWSRIGHVIN
jgi:signal peptidase I